MTLKFGGRHKDIVQTRQIRLYDVEFVIEKEHIWQSDQIIGNSHLSAVEYYLSLVLLAAFPLTVIFFRAANASFIFSLSFKANS